jgi:hypothetical protein
LDSDFRCGLLVVGVSIQSHLAVAAIASRKLLTAKGASVRSGRQLVKQGVKYAVIEAMGRIHDRDLFGSFSSPPCLFGDRFLKKIEI